MATQYVKSVAASRNILKDSNASFKTIATFTDIEGPSTYLVVLHQSSWHETDVSPLKQIVLHVIVRNLYR